MRAYNEGNDRPLTYSVLLDFMASYGRQRGGTYPLTGNTGYPNQRIFVFDPEFESFCRQRAEKFRAYRDDPNLVGYFSDNELPLGLHNLEGYLSLKDPEDPGRLAAEQWLAERQIQPHMITDAHRSEFAGMVARRYYRIVSRAIREVDPHHLYFGSRLHWKAKYIPEVVRAAGDYCDVVAINFYGEWAPPKEAMENWVKWARRPFMITEFYTKGMDSGLANTTGAGFTVRTQKHRGRAYQHFCLSLLESRGCVGWQWFKYQDNDPTARGVDPSNRDSNKGMVDYGYRDYKDLTGFMEELNQNTYRLIDYFD